MAVEANYRIRAEDRTTQAFNSARKNADKFAGSLKALSGIAAGLSVAGFGAMIKGAVTAGAHINDLSVRIGASTEALSQYQHVAEQTGVTFNTLTTAWQRQARRIAQATEGTGEAVKALDALNLSAEGLAALAPEEQFEIIADAMAGVANQGDKMAIAMQLWDTEGVALLQTIEGGSEAIQEMRDEADALGLTLDKMSAEQLAAADRGFAKISAQGTGLARMFAIELAPGIQFVAEIFGQLVKVIFQAAKTLGGLAASLGLVFEGEFALAAENALNAYADLGAEIVNVGTVAEVAWKKMKMPPEVESNPAKLAAIADEARNVAAANLEAALETTGYNEAVAAASVESARYVEVQAAVERQVRRTAKATATAAQVLSGAAPASAAAQLGTAGALGGPTSGESGGGFGIQDGILNFGGQRYVVQGGNFVARLDAQGRPTHMRSGFVPPGSAIQPGGGLRFATGGVVPTTGQHTLEAGERVVSNRTTTVNVAGVLAGDGGAIRQWVRDVLMPELEAAERA